MSYFSSSLARQGQYGSRPKVEMPEKTESAWWRQYRPFTSHWRSYLCPSVAGYTMMGIVPQAFMGARNRLLLMVAMGTNNDRQA